MSDRRTAAGMRAWHGLGLIALMLLASACGRAEAVSAQNILGRWQVVGGNRLTVPNSFFWFSMEYLEFRADGTLASLVSWPPDNGQELRLHKLARYTVTAARQIAVTGACRHQDPCTGRYAATLAGAELTLTDSAARLVLKRVADAGDERAPILEMPLPSPTPAEAPGADRVYH